MDIQTIFLRNKALNKTLLNKIKINKDKEIQKLKKYKKRKFYFNFKLFLF